MNIPALLLTAVLSQTAPTESTKEEVCNSQISTFTTVVVDGVTIAEQEVVGLVSDKVGLCSLPDPEYVRPDWCDEQVSVTTDGQTITVTKAEIVGEAVCPNS